MAVCCVDCCLLVASIDCCFLKKWLLTIAYSVLFDVPVCSMFVVCCLLFGMMFLLCFVICRVLRVCVLFIRCCASRVAGCVFLAVR